MKNVKKVEKKLVLKKETVSNIGNLEMGKIHGGGGCSNPKSSCIEKKSNVECNQNE